MAQPLQRLPVTLALSPLAEMPHLNGHGSVSGTALKTLAELGKRDRDATGQVMDGNLEFVQETYGYGGEPTAVERCRFFFPTQLPHIHLRLLSANWSNSEASIGKDLPMMAGKDDLGVNYHKVPIPKAVVRKWCAYDSAARSHEALLGEADRKIALAKLDAFAKAGTLQTLADYLGVVYRFENRENTQVPAQAFTGFVSADIFDTRARMLPYMECRSNKIRRYILVTWDSEGMQCGITSGVMQHKVPQIPGEFFSHILAGSSPGCTDKWSFKVESATSALKIFAAYFELSNKADGDGSIPVQIKVPISAHPNTLEATMLLKIHALAIRKSEVTPPKSIVNYAKLMTDVSDTDLESLQ